MFSTTTKHPRFHGVGVSAIERIQKKCPPAARVMAIPTLRHSKLWSMQSTYYEEEGVDSWDSGDVPSWITSNNFIASAYATAIVHALRDLRDTGGKLSETDGDIYIVELGSGNGKFSHLVYTSLQEKIHAARLPPQYRVVYVMTDFTSSNVASWLSNPCLSKHANPTSTTTTTHPKSNLVLDFGLFDAQKSDRIALWHSKTKLVVAGNHHGCKMTTNNDNSNGGGMNNDFKYVTNPMLVIANYVFDSLAQDVFRVMGNCDNRRDIMRDNHAASIPKQVFLQGSLNLDSSPSSSSSAASAASSSSISRSFQSLREEDWEFVFSPIEQETTSNRQMTDKYYTAEEFGQENANCMNKVLSWYEQNALSLAWERENLSSVSLALPSSSSSSSSSLANICNGFPTPFRFNNNDTNSNNGDDIASDSSSDSCGPSSADKEEDEDEDEEERDKLVNDKDENNSQASSTTTSTLLKVAASSFTFPFPVGAMRCLDTLYRLAMGSTITSTSTKSNTNGTLLVLCADKGFSDPHNFAGASSPDIHVHGSISMMVNFHALQLWTEVRGGACLVPPEDDVHLKVCAFILTGKNDTNKYNDNDDDTAPDVIFSIQRDLPLFFDTFKDRLESFGPGEFWDLQDLFADTHKQKDKSIIVTASPTLKETQERRMKNPPKGNEKEEASSSSTTTTTTRTTPIEGTGGAEDTEKEELFEDSDSQEEEIIRRRRPPIPLVRDPICSTPSGASSSSSSFDLSSSSSQSSSETRVTLRAAVALCRLSDWDAEIFYKFRDLFATRLPFLSPPRQQQIIKGMKRMYERGFASAGSQVERDVSFEVGRLLYLIGQYTEACSFFIESLQFHKDTRSRGAIATMTTAATAITTTSTSSSTTTHSPFEYADDGTMFNIGMCCYYMKSHNHAILWLQRAILRAHADGGRVHANAVEWLKICRKEKEQEDQTAGDDDGTPGVEDGEGKDDGNQVEDGSLCVKDFRFGNRNVKFFI